MHNVVYNQLDKDKKIIFSFFRIKWYLVWINLNPLHTRMCVPSLVKIVPKVLDSKIFIFPQCICNFSFPGCKITLYRVPIIYFDLTVHTLCWYSPDSG